MSSGSVKFSLKSTTEGCALGCVKIQGYLLKIINPLTQGQVKLCMELKSERKMSYVKRIGLKIRKNVSKKKQLDE